MKPRILILSDFYLPGCKSGGAVRTLVNTVDRLQDEFDFYVVTRNHDGWGDFEPYQIVKTGEWNVVGAARVFYFGARQMTAALLRKLWCEVAPDAVFAVSFFSSLTTQALTLRRLKRLPPVAVVLAPQGELAPNALSMKRAKKRPFIAVTKNLGLYKNIIWKASTETERAEIEKVFGTKARVVVAPDISPRAYFENYQFADKPAKRENEMRLVFLSRVNRKKNLSFALEALREIAGDIVFDVYGAHDDEIYWRECEELIKKLPPNVKVAVHGAVEYEDVAQIMSRYHFFILPTLNENFGHVVLESLAAGCPVLLSENTPWRGLSEKQIGWDIFLSDMEGWRAALRECVEMSANEFAARSQAARKFADDWFAAPDVENVNRELLRAAVGNAE